MIDSALKKSGTEKDLTNSRYHNVTSCCRYFARDEHGCARAWKNRERDREDERVNSQETSRSEDYRIEKEQTF